MSQALPRTLLSFIILIPTPSLFRTSATSPVICPSPQQQEVLRCDGPSFKQRHLHPHTCHPHTDACGEAYLVPHTPPGGGGSGKLREFLFLLSFVLLLTVSGSRCLPSSADTGNGCVRTVFCFTFGMTSISFASPALSFASSNFADYVSTT